MGGIGSTRWGSHHKKYVVEKCMKLDVKAFRLPDGEQILQSPGITGIIKWNDRAGVEYSVESHDDMVQLFLNYEFAGYIRNQCIAISTTECHYGGQRYWFHCPHCQRRSSNLYLLHGDFACRQCNHLTYTSSQKAHQSERMLRKIDDLLHHPDQFIGV